ncbi:hypothetical protein C6W23_06185 [Bacillus atrophaeus]|nr:hypothetical protein C6W23_06185 [Bacillus atrophaeus]
MLLIIFHSVKAFNVEHNNLIVIDTHTEINRAGFPIPAVYFHIDMGASISDFRLMKGLKNEFVRL